MGLLAGAGFLDAVYITSAGNPASGLSPTMTAIRLDTGATATPTVTEIGSLGIYKVTNWSPAANTEYMSIWAVSGNYVINHPVKLFKVGGGQEGALITDIGDFSGQSNLQSLLDVLAVPDVAGKGLYVCLITDRLDHGTYGLSALKTLLDAIPTTSEAEGYVENAVHTNASHDITTANDKTETQVFEITKTGVYELSVYLHLDALETAGEGGIVTVKLTMTEDGGTTYADNPIAVPKYTVGSSEEYPSIEADKIHGKCKLTIQCSGDVTATRAITYDYVTRDLGA